MIQGVVDRNAFHLGSQYLSENRVRIVEADEARNGRMPVEDHADAPPRFGRATFWGYRFTTSGERRATRAWWVREPLGLYLPVLTLVDGRLVPVESTLAPAIPIPPDSSTATPPG